MKKAVYSGFVAGLVSAIVAALMVSVGGQMGLFGWGVVYPESLVPYSASTFILLGVIFGPIVAVIYSRFYDLIPGKDLRKGLNFGLIVWFIKDIMAATYVTVSMMQPILVGVNLIVGGLYMWITYGLVLGHLYKK